MIDFQQVCSENQRQLLKLLEENAMQGWLAMLLTRQPNYLANQDYFGKEYAILAEEGGDYLGCCQLTKHQGFVNGELMELGYLNSLRVTKAHRNKIRVLKKGFEQLRNFAQPPVYCYSSIASDNKIARRILEHGVAGLPTYRFLGELCTLVISKKRAKSLQLWQKLLQPETITDFYNQHASNYQLAPYLTKDWLKQANLPCFGYYQNNKLSACAVLWNQQAFKQVFASYYHPLISLLRPIYNGYARLTKRPQLPKANQVLDQSFLAFFQVQDQQMLIPLIRDALCHCETSLLTVALAAEHPQLKSVIQAFKPITYRTRIYGVDLHSKPIWQQQILKPEAAIL